MQQNLKPNQALVDRTYSNLVSFFDQKTLNYFNDLEIEISQFYD